MGHESAGKVTPSKNCTHDIIKLTSSRLRTANILLVGLRALGNEIAKNLVLAGVGSLTIVDNGVVSEEDLGAQFFVRDYHVGQMVRLT